MCALRPRARVRSRVWRVQCMARRMFTILHILERETSLRVVRCRFAAPGRRDLVCEKLFLYISVCVYLPVFGSCMSSLCVHGVLYWQFTYHHQVFTPINTRQRLCSLAYPACPAISSEAGTVLSN